MLFLEKEKTEGILLFDWERDTGIEPASQAWEARALPMC